MIQKMSHTTIYVHDQDKALEFYVGKLGMEVRQDVTMPYGVRWLTIAPKGQELEIILMSLKPGPHLTEEDAEAAKRLIAKGVFGGGVLGTDDCRKTYEDLSAKGVEFTSPPKDEFYAVEALMKDPFGNWFSVTEPKRQG